MNYSIFFLLGYLIGSIPFGLLIARARGVDIRQVGSRNIGATNVFRCIGKPWGLLTFLLDFLKGFVPVLLALHLFSEPPPVGLVAGIGAILGHNFSIFLGFKGGKGVATSAGVIAALAPILLAVGLVTWLVLTLSTGYVSIGSMGTAIAVAGASWLLQESRALSTALTALALLIIWKHRTNLKRLMNGTENQFMLRKNANNRRNESS